ncbi:MAG: alpha/beta hydrolase [Candidatus Kapaibacterium sp.]
MSFWMVVMLLVVIPQPDLWAQQRPSAKPPAKTSAKSTADASVVPAEPTIDTVGNWRHIEQRRLGRYKTLLPPDYATTALRYPMVLLLHGNGNSPELLLGWFRRLKLDSLIVVVPEAPYVKIPETVGKRQGAYTGVADAIGAPDSLRGESIELTARWYADVMDDARRSYRIDTSKGTIVVGYSQGGFFAHILLTLVPESLAGVASISASVYPSWNVQSRFVSVPLPRPPVFVAHGVADPIVPYAVGQSYRAALDAAGFSPEFHPFDGGHWPTPEIERELTRWIMSIIR